MSALALLAGCGGGGSDGGGGGVDYSAYLPDFAAPAPVPIAVLTGGFAGINSGTVAAAELLLTSAAYLGTPASLEWLQANFDPSLSGQVYAMRSSGAAFAHAAGVTGDGELIAISDNHISVDHEVFAGKSVAVDSNGAAFDLEGDPVEHGTSVGSVAAGKSADFMGTAPDADLLFGSFGSMASLSDLGDLALLMGAVAWNNSWGYTDRDKNTLFVTDANYTAIFGDVAGQDYLESLSAYADWGVVVFAVSNEETNTNAGIMDGLPYIVNSLEAGWLAAVNGVPTFVNGVVDSVDLLSSACWESARWCLVADGSWNAAYGPASDYGFTTGSSFAAPQISGALALLAQAFPTLTPHELRIRLLASAEDDFFVGDDTVELADGYFKRYSVLYGHGFLDIEAALRPIGPTALELADGNTVSTNAPVLRTGSALGDAVELSLAGTNVKIHDVLKAGFVMPGEALATSARPGSQAGTLLAKSLRSDLAAERNAGASALVDPFAAFAGPTVRMEAADGSGSAAVLLPEGGSGAAGLTLSRALTEGATRLELGLKLIRDSGEVMGLDGSAAAMASVTLGLTQDLGNGGFVALAGEMGLTDLGGATQLTTANSASFNAVKLSIGQGDLFAAGDRLSFGVGLPVAISSGHATTRLPVVMANGMTEFQDVRLDLAPEDRQIDLEMTYQAALSDRVEMKLSLIHSDNFGNRAGQTDQGGAIAFAFRF